VLSKNPKTMPCVPNDQLDRDWSACHTWLVPLT
jgi:hypothetical protein